MRIRRLTIIRASSPYRTSTGIFRISAVLWKSSICARTTRSCCSAIWWKGAGKPRYAPVRHGAAGKVPGVPGARQLRFLASLGGRVRHGMGRADVRPSPAPEGDGAKRPHSRNVRELGEVLSPDTDLAALKALLREAFAPEFEYLRAMPFALESDKYIFVHGGIPHGETLESAGPWRCMKINSFYAARPHFKNGSSPATRRCVSMGQTPSPPCRSSIQRAALRASTAGASSRTTGSSTRSFSAAGNSRASGTTRSRSAARSTRRKKRALGLHPLGR